MKIAVSAMADNMDAMVDARFGRCAYFVIVEVEGNKIKGYEVIKNPGVTAIGGAGIQAAQIVVGKGVDVVITGNVGPNAFRALSTAGIKIVAGVGGITVKDAIDRYLKGELKETSAPTTPGFGPSTMNPGARLGTGRGRFRGPPMECVCPNCGFKMTKQRRIPCAQSICPRCGTPMVRA
ncbi:MAG TPA: dinitrogenase iron-molybdenum cofactor biosynthesis protein [Thermococcus sp.]|nr:dinitrogenase iron-molybdenum cofactor biosynthesis protein [Thermococcus sp.]